MEQSSGLANQQEIENDRHWIGAIVDGEGCITLSRRPPRSFGPRIIIVNTDDVLIEAIHVALRRLAWPYHVYRQKVTPHKAQFEIQGWKRVSRVLPELIPYLRGHKRVRAEKMLALAASRLRSGKKAPYSDEENELAADLLRS